MVRPFLSLDRFWEDTSSQSTGIEVLCCAAVVGGVTEVLNTLGWSTSCSYQLQIWWCDDFPKQIGWKNSSFLLQVPNCNVSATVNTVPPDANGRHIVGRSFVAVEDVAGSCLIL